MRLIGETAKHLQSEYTFVQVTSLLKQYGLDPGEPTVNSKRLYVEEQLEEASNVLILNVAADLGLVQGDAKPSENEALRLWGGDGFRLFISHVSKFRRGAHELAEALVPFGIRSFVAHDTIEPSLEWQHQIEQALRTMQALAVVVTEEVRTSAWCDQEIGWALGAGKLVIPVKVDTDPHGFVGKYQAVGGFKRRKPEVALDLAIGLTANEKTRRETDGVAFQLAVLASREESEDRFWRMIAAITDNQGLGSGFALKPLARKIDQKRWFKAGLTPEFAAFLRSKQLPDEALLVEAAEIPF